MRKVLAIAAKVACAPMKLLRKAKRKITAKVMGLPG